MVRYLSIVVWSAAFGVVFGVFLFALEQNASIQKAIYAEPAIQSFVGRGPTRRTQVRKSRASCRISPPGPDPRFWIRSVDDSAG